MTRRARIADRFGPRARLDLSKPRRRGIRFGVHYDPERFGSFSEGIARFIGTARFLVVQSIFIGLWVLVNSLAPISWRFDEYPMQFLTLILSLQAAYAAPLILLAQNRQAERDRLANERDRPLPTDFYLSESEAVTGLGEIDERGRFRALAADERQMPAPRNVRPPQ